MMGHGERGEVLLHFNFYGHGHGKHQQHRQPFRFEHFSSSTEIVKAKYVSKLHSIDTLHSLSLTHYYHPCHWKWCYSWERFVSVSSASLSNRYLSFHFLFLFLLSFAGKRREFSCLEHRLHVNHSTHSTLSMSVCVCWRKKWAKNFEATKRRVTSCVHFHIFNIHSFFFPALFMTQNWERETHVFTGKTCTWNIYTYIDMYAYTSYIYMCVYQTWPTKGMARKENQSHNLDIHITNRITFGILFPFSRNCFCFLIGSFPFLSLYPCPCLHVYPHVSDGLTPSMDIYSSLWNTSFGKRILFDWQFKSCFEVEETRNFLKQIINAVHEEDTFRLILNFSPQILMITSNVVQVLFWWCSRLVKYMEKKSFWNTFSMRDEHKKCLSSLIIDQNFNVDGPHLLPSFY